MSSDDVWWLLAWAAIVLAFWVVVGLVLWEVLG